MPLQSDLTCPSPDKFSPSAISQKTHDFNNGLIKIMESGPKWYEVGAEKYRQMRWNGETPLPQPRVLDEGVDTTIPSRDKGRSIPCRIFKSDGKKGVFLHIHGGGWVLQSEKYQDPLLAHIAKSTSLTVVSVGYRLAPEDPFPAGAEDCYDAVDYLINNPKEYGELQFIGGESAGGHLSVLAGLHILDNHPDFTLKGLILNFGAYDLSGFLPSVHNFDKSLVLDKDIMIKYIEAFTPKLTNEQRRDPSISPFFANLEKYRNKDKETSRLQPALFTCGTEDLLLDDTIMMAARWMMAGGEAVTKVYPGAPHGFILYPAGSIESVQEGYDDVTAFVKEKLR